ncbi:MAG TPA: aminopeptidase P family protein [Firmicutes bacterium]|nr:aminopeptidase P family protein [Candidatus Fermentithermobacillaceae bacterium]
MRKERWEKLFSEIREADLSGVALMPGPNLFYMTGLRMGLSERPTLCVVEGRGKITFLMPKLEARKGESAAKELAGEGVEADFDVVAFSDEEGPGEAFSKVFSGAGVKWGFEYRAMRLLELSLILAGIPGLEWVDAGEIMKKLRMIKDESELESMRKASRLADLGADIARKLLAPGRRGIDIAREIETQLKAEGAQAVGMSLATGVDTALPHAGTSTREIAEGDLAWLDLMVCVDGYWADITRSYAVGELEPEMKRAYRAVLEANEAARTKARPGMSGAEVDALAREVIESYGYGEYFIHRTGHGLGLEIHEDPYIVASNTSPLAIGSTFTIEPGVYIPGKGGIRIEDDVVMTESGLKSLTAYPRNLIDDDRKLVV